MSQDQILILGLVALTVILFFWGRWRHDVVALASLIAGVVVGLVPASSAFSGFGHPAVITVAAVLVLSQGLRDTGVVDVMARRLLPAEGGLILSILALTALAAVLSAFMNNVGAMALLMPIAIQLAKRFELPAGKVLMPLSFATILGGMTTLIGTPPNLIVSGYRNEVGLDSFGMFDFTPVGLAVALGGVLLVSLIGWRLVPRREPGDAASFDTGTYLTEVRVSGGSKVVDLTVRQADEKFAEADAQIVGMVRNKFRIFTPVKNRKVREGDILVIEAEPESLASVLSTLDVELEHGIDDRGEGSENDDENDESDENGGTEQVVVEEQGEELSEIVVMPNSRLIRRSAQDIMLRDRYGLTLLAISRQGRQTIKRLRSTTIQAGDVLLLQGSPEALSAFSSEFGGVPLAQRAVSIPDRGKATLAAVVMGAAIAASAFGLFPAAVAFTLGIIAFVVTGVIPAGKLYDSIDWPVIVLLGALLPIAGAMAETGAAELVARFLLDNLAQNNGVIAVALVLVLTMTLSDFMNNAATAAVMCPIAVGIAAELAVSPDSFLMAVAIGASCAMLTPIGHQNNTLILGPGGFRFSDYWRLGLPLEVIVIGISVPMLLWVWPL